MSHAKIKPPVDTIPVKMGETTINVGDEKIFENVKANIRRPVKQLDAYPPNGREIVIVAGGWSSRACWEEIRELHFQRKPVLAVNGSGSWLVSRNVRPSMLVVMDALAVNTDFVRDPITNCKYFLASQCDPGLFDACEGRDLTIFHVCTTGDQERDLLKSYYGRWREVVGSNTVTTRAIWLARMLGFEFIHVFGLDSCLSPDLDHHAYNQPWNDDDKANNIWCAGKKFRCTNWHIAQAEGFKDFTRGVGEHLNLTVHGDGLIAHMIKSGATIEKE